MGGGLVIVDSRGVHDIMLREKNMCRFEGCVVLVMGVVFGIGCAIVLCLVEEGVWLLCVDINGDGV